MRFTTFSWLNTHSVTALTFSMQIGQFHYQDLNVPLIQSTYTHTHTKHIRRAKNENTKILYQQYFMFKMVLASENVTNCYAFHICFLITIYTDADHFSLREMSANSPNFHCSHSMPFLKWSFSFMPNACGHFDLISPHHK